MKSNVRCFVKAIPLKSISKGYLHPHQHTKSQYHFQYSPFNPQTPAMKGQKLINQGRSPEAMNFLVRNLQTTKHTPFASTTKISNADVTINNAPCVRLHTIQNPTSTSFPVPSPFKTKPPKPQPTPPTSIHPSSDCPLKRKVNPSAESLSGYFCKKNNRF